MTPDQMLAVLYDWLPTAETINAAIAPHVVGDPGNRREAMWLAHVHSAAIGRSIRDTIRYLEAARREHKD